MHLTLRNNIIMKVFGEVAPKAPLSLPEVLKLPLVLIDIIEESFQNGLPLPQLLCITSN